MGTDIAAVSLLERVGDAGYRSSLVSTYCCYFPFYEEVVLRRLINAGCTHNVLMVDATCCAASFADEMARPRRAGRDYTLVPVSVGGAFHPKFFLQLGKAKGSLFVGSHNMTLAGFGLNDEVTTRFHAEGRALRTYGEPLRQTVEYLRSFLPGGLPDIVDAFDGLRLGIPWLEGPLGGSDERLLLTSSPASNTLWKQVKALIPKDVTRAFVCAPFFDNQLSFIRQVLLDVAPRELVVGVDPASVEVDPAQVAALPEVRWVNVAGVPAIPHRREGAHYLHAKLLWFEGADGELLVAGSANASAAAFLAPSASRNAEAVVAHRRIGSGEDLGIDALLASPPVTSGQWNDVAKRRAAQPASSGATSGRVLLAVPTATGFLAAQPLTDGLGLQARDADGGNVGMATVRCGQTIDAAEDIREAASVLEYAGATDKVLLVVHRTEEIGKNIGRDTRRALQLALGKLEEDPAQLETHLKLIEKVIFDSEEVVGTRPLRPPGQTDTDTDVARSSESLALDAAGRRTSRTRRSLAGGDISVLLDALMRRLGEGLATAPAPPSSDPVAEDATDEVAVDGTIVPKEPDLDTLARACRGKVRRLVKRMVAQLERAAAPDHARRGIIQLAAVLGVLRMLRVVERRPEWKRKQLELADSADLWSLFEEGILAVAWGANGLAPRAIAEADGGFGELSYAIALLAWLAWELEIDVEFASRRNGQQGIEDESWYSVQLFAALAPYIVGDTRAIQEVADSVRRTPRFHIDGDEWLRVQGELLSIVARMFSDPDAHGRAGRRPHPGDLAVLGEAFQPRIRVVLEVVPAGRDNKVVLFDAEDENGLQTFLASRVATLPWAVAMIRTTASS